MAVKSYNVDGLHMNYEVVNWDSPDGIDVIGIIEGGTYLRDCLSESNDIDEIGFNPEREGIFYDNNQFYADEV